MQADFERMMREGPPEGGKGAGGKGGRGPPGSPQRDAPKPAWSEVITALIGAGVNPNGTNADGVSFLMMAADMGATQVCESLLAGGADLRFRDKGGEMMRGKGSPSVHLCINVLCVSMFFYVSISLCDVKCDLVGTA